jgi:hypothetical protein
MKTNRARPNTIAASVIVTSLLAASSYAGSGPQYWANLHKAAKTTKATETTQVTKPAAALAPRASTRHGSVTVMEPSWSNGRGPLVEKQLEGIAHVTVAHGTGQ